MKSKSSLISFERLYRKMAGQRKSVNVNSAGMLSAMAYRPKETTKVGTADPANGSALSHIVRNGHESFGGRVGKR